MFAPGDLIKVREDIDPDNYLSGLTGIIIKSLGGRVEPYPNVCYFEIELYKVDIAGTSTTHIFTEEEIELLAKAGNHV